MTEMIALESTNVLLKGSTKKQLLGWLKRSLKMAQRLGDFAVKITLQRVGNVYRMTAYVIGSGPLECHAHGHDLRETCRKLVHRLSEQLHTQRLRQTLAA